MLLVAIYAVSFLPPLAVRSWRALVLMLGGSVLFVLGIIELAGRGGGFVVFIFSFAIAAVAAGLLSGCATKAVLLATKSPTLSWRSAAITILGLLALPAALLARDAYRGAASRAAYARLPTAKMLPAISACGGFREGGPLLDTIVVRDERNERIVLPAADTRIRYPVRYLEFALPLFPETYRSQLIKFQMHVTDKTSVQPSESKNAAGDWIAYEKRLPAVSFQVLSREPVARSASRSLRIGFGEILPLAETPDLDLVPSPYWGLSAVRNSIKPNDLYPERYVAMQGAEISDYVECTGSDGVPNPSCNFQFDRAGLAVGGSFRRVNLGHWQTIKGNIQDFVDCARAGGTSGPAETSPLQ